MTHAKQTIREGILCGTLAVILFGMLISHAAGQDSHPAFGAKQTSALTIETNTADIPKLEEKAIEILRRVGTVTGETMTLTEARAKVRVDANGSPDAKGRTDVARCVEIVVTDRLRGIVQTRVERVTVANTHPGGSK